MVQVTDAQDLQAASSRTLCSASGWSWSYVTPGANLNPTPAPGAETLMHIPAASQPGTALILHRSCLQDITFDAGGGNCSEI